MKKIFLFYTLIYCLGTFAQTKVEYVKGLNNTYKRRSYSDFISVRNIIVPFNKSNDVEWGSVYKVTDAGKNIYPIFLTHIGPCLKNLIINDENDETFSFDITYNLKGEMSVVSFVYPKFLNIPIETLENLETELKKNGNIKLEPYSTKRTEGVYYIYRPEFFSLKEIQDAYNKLNPTPEGAITPGTLSPPDTSLP